MMRRPECVAIIKPDTSPRGEDVADDPAYDLGGPVLYRRNQRWAALQTKVTAYRPTGELLLPPCRGADLVTNGRHGALTCDEVSRPVPKRVRICADCVADALSWGEKAFSAYLGQDRDMWRAHDASLLIEAEKAAPYDDILIDQGRPIRS